MRHILLSIMTSILLMMASACNTNQDTSLYNRLTGVVWNIDNYTIMEYFNGFLDNEISINNYGTFLFNADGTGFYTFHEPNGFTYDGSFQWSNTDAEVIITLDGTRSHFQVIDNYFDEQVWTTEYNYGDGFTDVIWMTLSR